MSAITWTGPHGLSLGGSFKGIHAASLTGYWIHDHVAGRRRFKIYKIGVTRQIGSAPTFEKAKSFCLEHITEGARRILYPAFSVSIADGEGNWEALVERGAAIADTHPEDGDVEQAPLGSGGGAGTAIAQGPSQ